MAKQWVLTRQAKAALKDIAVWTVETFGRRQADAYAEDLIEKCQALADGAANGAADVDATAAADVDATAAAIILEQHLRQVASTLDVPHDAGT